MIGAHFSLILLPTNKCNVACEYCFEDKTDDFSNLIGYNRKWNGVSAAMFGSDVGTSLDFPNLDRKVRRSLPVLRALSSRKEVGRCRM